MLPRDEQPKHQAAASPSGAREHQKGGKKRKHQQQQQQQEEVQLEQEEEEEEEEEFPEGVECEEEYDEEDVYVVVDLPSSVDGEALLSAPAITVKVGHTSPAALHPSLA